MKQSRTELPTRLEAGGVCIQAQDSDDINVPRIRFPKDADATPLPLGWVGALLAALALLACGAEPVSGDPQGLDARGPAHPKSPLEVVAKLHTAPANVAVSSDGRIFLSQHQFWGPELKVVELVDVDDDGFGITVPFPNADWNDSANVSHAFQAVLGLRYAADGTLWVLDNGAPRMIGFDLVGNEPPTIIDLSPSTIPGSFVNDIALDMRRNLAYIADTAFGLPVASGAIIVVDLETGYSRRVLQGHPSLQREDGVSVVIDGSTVNVPPIDADGITIDPNNHTVYYGPISGRSLYSLKTKYLADSTLSDDELDAKIRRAGDKPINDGILADRARNIYQTDLENSAIGVTRPNGDYQILYQDDERLSWPDGLSFGPGRFIYVTANQLHRSPGVLGLEEMLGMPSGRAPAEPPYYLLRFKSLVPGRLGR